MLRVHYNSKIFTKAGYQLLVGQSSFRRGVQLFASGSSDGKFLEINPNTLSLYSLMKNLLPRKGEQNLSWVREGGYWFLGGGSRAGAKQLQTTTNPILELPTTSGIDIHNHPGTDRFLPSAGDYAVLEEDKKGGKKVISYILNQRGVVKFQQPFPRQSRVKLLYCAKDGIGWDQEFSNYYQLRYSTLRRDVYFSFFPSSDYSPIFKQIKRTYSGEGILHIFSQDKEVIQFLSWGWILELVDKWGLDIHKYNSMQIFLNTRRNWVKSVLD